MRKIAYIFQEITFSCCCLFIKETTLSLINDFQKFLKMFKKKMFQNVLVTHRRMIKSILLQNLPLPKL